MADEDGPVWLRMERLVRTRPPEPALEIAEWILVSQDADKVPEIKESLHRRVSMAERDALFAQNNVREGDAPPSLKADKSDPPGTEYFDCMMRLEDRPELGAAIDLYCAGPWAAWAQAERPRRKSIAVYQRLFQIAQVLGMGGEQAELVWGIGLAKWRKPEDDIDVPLIERGVEIEIDHGGNAAITIRPRDQGARVELRPFQRLAGTQFNLAEDAARKALRGIENAESEGLSPFRRETFEPILRLCRSQLDAEGRYLPDHTELSAASPVPPTEGGQLQVSDRYVLFARRRSANSVLNDIEKLKTKLAVCRT